MFSNNYPVDQCSFVLVRGVQNEILFSVRDIDRNVATTTNYTAVTINIVDPQSSTLMMTRNLTVVDAPTALYKLTVLASETADWETGALQYSLSVTRTDASTVMLWTDQNYGPYSYLEVKHGPLPIARAAQVLDPSTFIVNGGATYSSQLNGAAQLGYQNGMHSFAVYPVTFTGTVMVQASLAAQPGANDWFGVVTHTYTATSTLDLISVQGSYLYLRVVVTTTSGTINQILYTN